MLFRKYRFWSVFGRFCPKSAAVRQPNLPANQLFSTVGFLLFCRIFGRLATVENRVRMPQYRNAIGTQQFKANAANIKLC
jgi:hypothetical protein